jgi:hypothetical protein
VKLVEEIGNKKELGHVYIKKGNVTLSIRRGGEAASKRLPSA